jgi:cytochrome c5
MFRRVGLLTALAAIASCSRSEVKTGVATSEPTHSRPTFTLFAVAEMRGQIGPCGCTTDPLGDISRTVELVNRARKEGPVLFVDAGSLLYSRAPIPPLLAAQEELKADLLAETYRTALKVDAVGVGPSDLAAGLDRLRLPRLVSNLPEVPADEPKLVTVGDAKVGMFGVVAEGAVTGVKIADPVAAGKHAVGELRARGAQVVVGLIQADSKRAAVQLARDIGGIDIAVAGLGLAAPEPDRIDIEALRIGDGWMIIPANRGQVVSRLDVTLRGPGPLADAGGRGAAVVKSEVLERQLAQLNTDLQAFAKDKTADPAFVAQKQQERTKLLAERERLRTQPLVVPERGSYFTFDQVRIRKSLACNTAVQDAISKFHQATGEVNVKAAANVAVPAPPKDQASYVGGEACSDCHSDATEAWKKTVHARAWATLEQRGRQFDLDCIGCHVTGWERPGGSNLADNSKLRDVQCETCHGPGSIHVAKGGLEKPFAIQRAPADDLCATQCHTKDHSDTFELNAYLRDIVGPGHGKAKRDALGAGPTGGQLRTAGHEKAGSAFGAGCKR